MARAKVHPDKLKKPGMSAEEEKEIDDASTAVAQAAEILKDPMVVSCKDQTVCVVSTDENAIASTL